MQLSERATIDRTAAGDLFFNPFTRFCKTLRNYISFQKKRLSRKDEAQSAAP